MGRKATNRHLSLINTSLFSFFLCLAGILQLSLRFVSRSAPRLVKMKTEADISVAELTDTVDISRHFDGQLHWNWAKWGQYRNPDRVAEQAMTSEHFVHRDIFSRITTRPKDVLRYLSPTDGKAKRMRVQSTDVRQSTGDWRRVKVTGNAPFLLRLSSWIVKRPGVTVDVTDILLIAGKVLLVIPAHLLLLWIPMGNTSAVQTMYYGLPLRCWDYPKYARNQLDSSPLVDETVDWKDQVYTVGGDQSRLLRPRRLIVCHNGTWELVAGATEPYLFISYTATQFSPRDARACRKLEALAQAMTEEAGLNAYWLDHRCMEPTPGPAFTDDVHRICDVIRGAVQVCIIVPDFSEASLHDWGKRMWTLPEALLSPNANIKFCSPESTMQLSKIALAADVWKDGETSRLLAEHFTGLLTLSRLELISLGLEALGNRETQNLHTQGDLAYALMSLLKQRPRMNPHDTLFQALARLSLANDSDQIVERMICMLPDVGASPKLNRSSSSTTSSVPSFGTSTLSARWPGSAVTKASSSMGAGASRSAGRTFPTSPIIGAERGKECLRSWDSVPDRSGLSSVAPSWRPVSRRPR